MLKCERTTPLGSPVLPLLKMMVAVSSTVGSLHGAGQTFQHANRGQDGQRESDSSGPARVIPAITSSR